MSTRFVQIWMAGVRLFPFAAVLCFPSDVNAQVWIVDFRGLEYLAPRQPVSGIDELKLDVDWDFSTLSVDRNKVHFFVHDHNVEAELIRKGFGPPDQSTQVTTSKFTEKIARSLSRMNSQLS